MRRNLSLWHVFALVLILPWVSMAFVPDHELRRWIALVWCVCVLIPPVLVGSVAFVLMARALWHAYRARRRPTPPTPGPRGTRA